jgi:hypothetical protein
VCYILICWATADNLARMSGTLHLPSAPGAGAGWSAAEQTARAFLSSSSRAWRAPIAACAIGGVMAALFNLASGLVLVRRSLLPPGASSFGYGFVTAWALVLAFTTLLCGLVLEAFRSTVRDHVDPATALGPPSPAAPAEPADGAGAAAAAAAAAAAGLGGARGWTRAMTGAYAASYGFAYACTALYSLFFLALLGFQKAVARQLSAPERAAIEVGVVAAGGGGGGGGGAAAAAALYSQANAI